MEFYELKLGNLTMKDLCSKFLSLLRYVPYIAEEKPKVQRFLSCLPAIYKDIIEYDDPKVLEEAMCKAKICYEQNKNRTEHTSRWKGKRTDNYNQGRKNNRFSNNRNLGSNYKGYRGTNYKGNSTSNQPEGKGKEPFTFYNKNANQREVTTIGEIARSIPQIIAALENRQAEYQTSMVEVEGMLKQISISI